MADQDNYRDFSEVGISISESQTGRIRIACPFCGPNRIHRPHERYLSVDTDKGLYHCYHCGESGYVPTKGEQKARAKQQKQRPSSTVSWSPIWRIRSASSWLSTTTSEVSNCAMS